MGENLENYLTAGEGLKSFIPKPGCLFCVSKGLSCRVSSCKLGECLGESIVTEPESGRVEVDEINQRHTPVCLNANHIICPPDWTVPELGKIGVYKGILLPSLNLF